MPPTMNYHIYKFSVFDVWCIGSNKNKKIDIYDEINSTFYKNSYPKRVKCTMSDEVTNNNRQCQT